jgi:hypothetical protein
MAGGRMEQSKEKLMLVSSPYPKKEWAFLRQRLPE